MRAIWIATVIVLAGCAGDTTEPVLANEPEIEAPEVTHEWRTVATVLPVAWTGHTKEGIWVCNDADGDAGCPAGTQIQPDGAHTTTLGYEHNLTRIEFNLTWTPADASQGALVIAVYGNVTGQGAGLIGKASGTSPLQVLLEAPDVVPDGNLSVVVWPQGKTPTAPSVFVDATQQPFSLDGVLVTSDMVWVQLE